MLPGRRNSREKRPPRLPTLPSLVVEARWSHHRNAAGLTAGCARRPPAAKRLDEESPEEAPPVCGEGEVADGPAELSYKTPKRRCSLKGMFLGSFVVRSSGRYGLLKQSVRGEGGRRRNVYQ